MTSFDEGLAAVEKRLQLEEEKRREKAMAASKACAAFYQRLEGWEPFVRSNIEARSKGSRVLISCSALGEFFGIEFSEFPEIALLGKFDEEWNLICCLKDHETDALDFRFVYELKLIMERINRDESLHPTLRMHGGRLRLDS